MHIIKDRLPHAPTICRLPQATARRAEVIDRRLARYPCDRRDSTGAVRADETPLHRREEIWIVLLTERASGRYQNSRRENENEMKKANHDSDSD